MSACAIFRALGDETRLELLRRVGSEPIRMSSVGDGLDLSRQGVRKHLAVLEQAGLISLEQRRREVLVRANPAGIADGRRYLEEVERMWDRRLENLRAYVEGCD